MKTIDNIHYMTIPPLRRASLEARDDLNKRLMDSLYQQRCDDDLPESIQIARVNGKLMR